MYENCEIWSLERPSLVLLSVYHSFMINRCLRNILRLKKEDLLGLEGFGETRASSLIEEIEYGIANANLLDSLVCLGIYGVGIQIFQNLTLFYHSLKVKTFGERLLRRTNRLTRLLR